MRVFNVLYHSEWADCPSHSEIIGTFFELENAIKCMRDEAESVLANTWNADEEDTDYDEYDDNITIFDKVGGIDYIKLEIVPMDVK